MEIDKLAQSFNLNLKRERATEWVCEWCLFETLHTATWLHAFYRSFCLINQIISLFFSCFVHPNAFFVQWKVHRNWFHQMNFLTTHKKSMQNILLKYQVAIVYQELWALELWFKTNTFTLRLYLIFNENQDINYRLHFTHLKNKMRSPNWIDLIQIVNSSSNSKAIYSIHTQRAHTKTYKCQS